MSKKTAFITGIAGQDGAYLADFLLKKNYRVIGLAHSARRQSIWRLDYLGIRRKIKIIAGSILDDKLIKNILVRYLPQEIYNLAGESSVAKSWLRPDYTLLVNAAAVAALLENIRQFAPRARLFQAGSVEMYGRLSGPVSEATGHFAPLNPYASAKLAAHWLVKNYRAQYGLFACNGIMLTHTSPLQVDSTLFKNIVRAVTNIFLTRAKILPIGNLNMRRDFSFAGDTVAAMWLMLQQPQPRDFVICSGVTRSVAQLVKTAFNCAGIKNWRRYVKINPKLVGKRSLLTMSGSNRALKKIGWKPDVSFNKLVKMAVDYELKISQNDQR